MVRGGALGRLGLLEPLGEPITQRIEAAGRELLDGVLADHVAQAFGNVLGADRDGAHFRRGKANPGLHISSGGDDRGLHDETVFQFRVFLAGLDFQRVDAGLELVADLEQAPLAGLQIAIIAQGISLLQAIGSAARREQCEDRDQAERGTGFGHSDSGIARGTKRYTRFNPDQTTIARQ